MQLTLEQHYDITWLVLLLCIVLWFCICLLGNWIYQKRLEAHKRRLREKYEYDTRYSFMNPGEKKHG